MPGRSSKRPRDPNQLAKLVVDIAIGEVQDVPPEPENAKAVAGRKGGLRGGNARAAKMTQEERSRIAKRAADARWSRRPS